MMQLIFSTYVPIINNQSKYMDTYVENISCIIPFLHNAQINKDKKKNGFYIVNGRVYMKARI
ncbi:hypothetical protein ACT453_56565, partial [Bacillus sp. D-CC]